MDFEYDPREASTINDDTHLENFVNYMFRTDRAQKNTNADTLNNIYAVWNNGDVKTYSQSVNSPKERRKFRDDLLQIAWEHPSTNFLNDIIYLDDIDRISEEELINLSLQAAIRRNSFYEKDVVDAKLYVDKAVDRDLQICTHIFASALHADQGGRESGITGLHIHTLYLVEWISN